MLSIMQSSLKKNQFLEILIMLLVTSNEAYQDQGDVTEILDKAEQTLFSLSKDADKGRFKVSIMMFG